MEHLGREAAQAGARTPWREEVWARLAGNLRFVPGAFDDDAAFDLLGQRLADLCDAHGIGGNAAFYLSIPPAAFPVVLKQVQRTRLADSAHHGGWPKEYERDYLERVRAWFDRYLK